MGREPDKILGYKLKKFQEITRRLDGIQPGFYIIGGRPGVGKTALMTNLFLDLLSSNPETRGTYFSFDENRESMRSRLMSISAGIPINKVRKGHDSPMLYAKRKKAHNELMSLVVPRRLDIKDLSEISDMDELELEVRQRVGDDSLVFIDGLNNLQATESDQEQDERAGKIKGWVDMYRIPIFCTVSLRKAEKDESVPNLDNIMEIGNYGYAASVVLLLNDNQQRKMDRRDDEPIPITLKFEKNRLSDFKGTVQLELMLNTGVFTEGEGK